jgi:hypothetical protein
MMIKFFGSLIQIFPETIPSLQAKQELCSVEANNDASEYLSSTPSPISPLKFAFTQIKEPQAASNSNTPNTTVESFRAKLYRYLRLGLYTNPFAVKPKAKTNGRGGPNLTLIHSWPSND